MSIPDFQTIMLPLLRITGDGKEYSVRDFVDQLAKTFALSEQELEELIPSGTQTIFYNRVGWARTYLSKSGLLEMTYRPYYRITERGKEVLVQKPERIDMKFLRKFPEFVHFKEVESAHKPKVIIPAKEGSKTPEEILEDAYQEVSDRLADEILDSVMSCSPAFFERLVVELLVKMGYGGSQRDAARAVGQTGDGGIDGIIDEDRLGLDTIYIQAKRWKDPVVGRPEIQKFVGALAGKHAKRGIFITTSSFTTDASEYAAEIDTKVILIDGKKLADFMIEYNIGVTEVSSYQIKRIDSDYFNNV
jgi:restriction system protein